MIFAVPFVYSLNPRSVTRDPRLVSLICTIVELSIVISGTLLLSLLKG